MSQTFNVVLCCQCSVYQVDINKKSTNKWTCKLCGLKQSLKQIHYQGESKECRIRVKALNELKIQKQNEIDNQRLVQLEEEQHQQQQHQNQYQQHEQWHQGLKDECEDENYDYYNESYETNQSNQFQNFDSSCTPFNQNGSEKKQSKWSKYLTNSDEET